MISRSWTARSALAALALAVSVVAFPTTASATSHQAVEYDALGDSYASGYGVPPYDACGRSQSAYAVQLDRLRRIDLDDFVACAGATTKSLVEGGQLRALDEDTDLVTISIGGNDIDWVSAVAACLGGTDEQCAGAVAATRAFTTTVLPGLLDSVYSKVSARAPHAQVVITGYARLFSPRYGPVLEASVSEQKAINDVADLLNKVIARAAAKHCFEFVDVTEKFLGHGLNAPPPHAWILGPLDPAAFHPDIVGYRAYTAAVIAAIKPSRP
jgi:lysophospholipase L1-like esterase